MFLWATLVATVSYSSLNTLYISPATTNTHSNYRLHFITAQHDKDKAINPHHSDEAPAVQPFLCQAPNTVTSQVFVHLIPYNTFMSKIA